MTSSAITMASLRLGEPLKSRATVRLRLCCRGVAVLLFAVLGTGVPHSLLLAIGCALSWAGGTVYVKWAQIRGDLVAVTAWQLVICTILTAIGLLWVVGIPSFMLVRLSTALGTAYSGIVGMAVAYL